MPTLPTPPDTPARDPATPDLHEWAEDAARALDRGGLLRTPRRFWPVLACHLTTSVVVAALVFGLVATGHDALETAAYAWPLVFGAQAVGELVALWPGRNR
jgi:hypothetical protein